MSQRFATLLAPFDATSARAALFFAASGWWNDQVRLREMDHGGRGVSDSGAQIKLS